MMSMIINNLLYRFNILSKPSDIVLLNKVMYVILSILKRFLYCYFDSKVYLGLLICHPLENFIENDKEEKSTNIKNNNNFIN
jgi:hypothetical protein